MIPVEFLDLLAAAEKLYAFRHLILSRANVASGQTVTSFRGDKAIVTGGAPHFRFRSRSTEEF